MGPEFRLVIVNLIRVELPLPLLAFYSVCFEQKRLLHSYVLCDKGQMCDTMFLHMAVKGDVNALLLLSSAAHSFPSKHTASLAFFSYQARTFFQLLVTTFLPLDISLFVDICK